MPLKIFISYRRQDSGANAIGIGQYLENEFGRKNIYIDVDMHAGTKYPAVIEKHLAECKVLLVLIGPEWLGSKDERGLPRLQRSDDWVRLEIAHALKRDIIVIPVLINGARLPDKEMLPVDIQGLLDHQVASVSITSFRHEMAGLVSDIRSIRPSRPWRLFGSIAAAALFLLAGVILAQSFGFHNLLGRVRLLVFSPASVSTTQNYIWKSRPGEWIMFAYDNSLNAYFFNPSSIKAFGDNISYTGRFLLKSVSVPSSEKNSAQGAYEDNITALNCKKSIYAVAERTVYNTSGEIIFHFKTGEPESLDLAKGQSIGSGSILALGQRIICDQKLRTLLLSKRHLDTMHLSYLSNTSNGDGGILYGPINPTSNSIYRIEVLFVTKLSADHELAELFPGQNVRGLPSSYRTSTQTLQLSCEERKIMAADLEYYDKDENLVYLMASISVQPMDVKNGSIFGALLDVVCNGAASNAAGNYEGINNATYEKGQGEQKIAISVQQTGHDLKIKFQSVGGGQGEGIGKLRDNRVDPISLISTAPECPGSYDGSLSFTDNAVSWIFKGRDCGGPMEGHGTATKVTR